MNTAKCQVHDFAIKSLQDNVVGLNEDVKEILSETGSIKTQIAVISTKMDNLIEILSKEEAIEEKVVVAKLENTARTYEWLRGLIYALLIGSGGAATLLFQRYLGK